MSKPPFKMPSRSEAPSTQLDEWVSGKENSSGLVAPSARAKADKTSAKLARLTIDLPPELHAKFKSTCALRGTRMIDEVRQFIEGWTQKHG